MTISGRVVDPDGKPVRGAKLLFLYFSARRSTKKVWATSSAEGRFSFTVPVKEVENSGLPLEKPWEYTHVLAAAEGYGFAVAVVGKPGAAGLTLRLVKDDAPIRGRILDLQGKPVAIQTIPIRVMTRPRETIHVPAREIGRASQRPIKGSVAYFGSVFDFVAAPTRPIVGIVRDRDTGKPLAGVTIESVTIEDRFGLGAIRTTTDENGRYRLVGLPKSNRNEIAARTYETFSASRTGVPNERPYLSSVKRVGNPLGLETVTVDFALKRGVWVKGRVTEEATGKILLFLGESRS